MAPDVEALVERLHRPSTQIAQGAYFTLVISGGLVLLPLVLVTFALSKVPARNAALVNFLVALVVFSFGIALLPLTGQLLNPTPSRSLCFFQLGVMQGGLTMAATAAVTIVIHLAVTLPRKQGAPSPLPRGLRVAMSALPGAAFVIYILAQAEAALSLGDELLLDRGALVCRFADGSPFFFKKGPLVIMLVAISVDIVASVYLVIRIKDAFRLVGISAWRQLMSDASPHNAWMALLLRLCLFEIVCTFVVIVVAIDELAPTPTSHFLAVGAGGTVPLLSFLIFGTVSGLRRTWYLWLCRIPPIFRVRRPVAPPPGTTPDADKRLPEKPLPELPQDDT